MTFLLSSSALFIYLFENRDRNVLMATYNMRKSICGNGLQGRHMQYKYIVRYQYGNTLYRKKFYGRGRTKSYRESFGGRLTLVGFRKFESARKRMG